MTIKEFQIKLQKKANDIRLFSEPLRFAAFDATALMGNRIFDNGRKADGSEIINHKAGIGATQHYSEKPIYISKSAIPRPRGVMAGKPKGKRKTGNKKREIKRKGELFAVETNSSKYFATGYKGYRENVGRQTDHIDLKLSGELRQDFANDKKIAEPVKINDLEYQIRLDKPINQDKRSGLEDKYGEIFTISESEKEKFYNTIRFKFREALAK